MISTEVPIGFTFHGLPAGEFLDGVPVQPGEYLCDVYRGPGHLEFVQYLEQHGKAECAFETPAGTIYFVVNRIRPGHRLQVSEISQAPILPDFAKRMNLKERLFGPEPGEGSS